MLAAIFISIILWSNQISKYHFYVYDGIAFTLIIFSELGSISIMNAHNFTVSLEKCDKSI